MDKETFSSFQLLFFTLCFLHSILVVTGTLTVDPTTACVGDRITINCSLAVPGAGDIFSTLDANYIVGNDDAPISPAVVNINAMSGGVDLSKLMAVTVFGNTTFVEGRLILLSYLPEDNNTRLGCGNEYRINGNSANRAILRETINVLQADTVVVSESTAEVKPNISMGLFIYSTVFHNLSSVQRPEILTYNLTLHINETTETLSNVPISQVNSTAFSNKFLLDTYYRISVSAMNCIGGSGSVFSKTFFLLRLRDNNWELNRPEPYHVVVMYTELIEPPGSYEQDYLSKDYFTFTVVNNDNNEIIRNLTDSEFKLFLPQRFEFNLPDTIETFSGKNFLKIYFTGELIGTIPLTVLKIRSSTLMIILIVLFVLLVVLLFIIITIIISFVLIHFKRKRDSEK